MKWIPITVLCALSALLSTPAIACQGDDHVASHTQSDEAVTPYILNTCAISGEDLGSMSDAIVKVYEGREAKFCCQMCVPRFEKDIEASLANIDTQIIETQLKFYPMTTCVISGEVLESEDMGGAINYLHGNRLVRFCCKLCKSDFKKDPDAYIAKLDLAVIAQQSEAYPLSTCPISGGDLGSMGDAINVVYAGRLVKFCCQMCVPKFEANPMATIAKLDAAWMAMHKNTKHDHNGHDGKSEHHHDD